MGKIFDRIDGKLADWMRAQRLFFVATAPSGDGGHVNCSPKGGIDTFRIVGPNEVAYVDFVGSGAETIAHLRENGRIVVMFCAFEGPPRIVRLHGFGRVVQIGEPEFDELYRDLGFAEVEIAEAAARSIIRVQVERIADSCGYGVPRMSYGEPRPQYMAWADAQFRKNGAGAVLDYSRKMNEASIDGLPAIEPELLPDRT
jgi:hypothetical protein